MADQSNQTREQILTAAMELIAEKGYHEASMAAIAERANVGKGTLYWHFQSKDELVKQMFSEKTENLFAQIHALRNQEIAPIEAIKGLIRVKFEFAVRHRELAQILMRVGQISDNEFAQKMFQKHVEMIGDVEWILQQGILQDAFKTGSTKQMALGIVGMINGISSLIFYDQLQDLDEAVNFTYKMILNGIAKLAEDSE